MANTEWDWAGAVSCSATRGHSAWWLVCDQDRVTRGIATVTGRHLKGLWLKSTHLVQWLPDFAVQCASLVRSLQSQLTGGAEAGASHWPVPLSALAAAGALQVRVWLS